jgi:predicted dehydrogenase/threonine dehydrogenase-like Zn-dependent dehydrogenase
MKQVIIKDGKGMAMNVALPSISEHEILVRTAFSFVSVGTELSSVSNTGKPLWRRALENPSEVKKVFKTIRAVGLNNTKGMVFGRLGDGNEVGYSSSGTIIAVGDKIKSFKVGDDVACAGAGYAMHAQYVAVPENLVTLKPKKVSFQQAATVAVGSIALNSVRRSKPEQGDVFLVIGLGLLGNLVCQFLSNCGCRVVGVDPDSIKVNLANKIKNTEAFCQQSDAERVLNYYSKGHGADGVVVAAASKSDDIISLAFNLCRKKGRVVVVGDVGLSLKRKDFYKKEIDFFIATSYGPGRYDDSYELFGQDYPYAFVRWTENRNMLLYLDLIESGSINIDFLTENIFDIEESEVAYETVKKSESVIAILFDHHCLINESPQLRKYSVGTNYKIDGDKVGVGIIGAGSFCRGMHLPNINKLDNLFQIHAIANRTGNKARSVTDQYHAKYSTTDYQELLNDKEVDAVIITTRHNTHWKIVCDSLQAGKHVFVEKPLALSQTELDAIVDTYTKTADQVLMVGYNRRFSNAIQLAKSKIIKRKSPIIVNYLVNAGSLSGDHWVNRSGGGGRNLGEACHMYDVFTYLTEAPYTTVTATSIGNGAGMYSWRDNFTVAISFEDGSICNLIYTSMGSSNLPKERITIFSEGVSVSIDDFKKVIVYQNDNVLEVNVAGKGHLEEIKSFGDTIRSGGELPIPFWQLLQASKIALEVEDKIQGAST